MTISSQAPETALDLPALLQALPPRLWYLTSNGTDMWCRRPYGFLFTDGERAEAFAGQLGLGEGLFAVGCDAAHFATADMLGGLAATAVTRLFLDPQLDADSGDVHGKILRLGPLQ